MRNKISSFRNKKLQVFIADDDTADLNFFQNALREIADEVKITLVRDGRELLGFLKLVVPDIIFLNANMQCADGVDCLTAVRAQQGLDKVPVLVYSDQASKIQVYKTYIQGANLFISKPRYFRSLKKELLQKLSLKISEIVPQPSINDYVLDLAE
jgi:PleD family two-component response regulator